MNESENADVTAELVDVGLGARDSDYEGKDVRGKLVLCDATLVDIKAAAEYIDLLAKAGAVTFGK